MNNYLEVLTSSERYKSIFNAIKQVSEKTNSKVYLVGGAVRDLIRGEKIDKINDLDFVVFYYEYDFFAKEVSKLLKKPAIPFKDNMRIPWNEGYVDISSPRGENIHEDLSLRDFTINNLAIGMDGKLIGDPKDVKNAVVSQVYSRAFDDDPVRILRGYRLAAVLNYKLSPEFLKLSAEKKHLLKIVASERVHEELKKLSQIHDDHGIFMLMDKSGVWEYILGFKPHANILVEVLKNMESNEDMRFALFVSALAVGHENIVNNILTKLNVSNKVGSLVLQFLKVSRVFCCGDESALRYHIWKHHKIFSPALFFASVCYGLPFEKCEEIILMHGGMDIGKSNSVNGNDLMALAKEICPEKTEGKWIANLLEDTKVMLAFGTISNRKEALNYLQNKLQEQ